MLRYAANMNTFINCALLTPVYFLGVGLTSTLAKVSGKRFLQVEGVSGWMEFEEGKKPVDEIYRQF